MDATHQMFCNESDMVNPLSSMGMQVSCILVISHFFNIVLKTLGQPGSIAQILAGLVLGPTALSHIQPVKDIFFLHTTTNYYEVVSFFCRILFMFLFGLEIDIHYTMRNIRLASLVACGGAIMGAIFGLAVSFFLYQALGDNSPKAYFNIIIMLVVAYTGSPIVIRLTSELRVAASDVGRIAISSAIITEMSCLVCFNLMINWHAGSIAMGLCCILVTTAVIFINRYLAIWLNNRHPDLKYLTAPELLIILLLLLTSSLIIEIWGYNSIVNCFAIGLMFPKEGKTGRTLLHKLGYSIYNFVLPVYLGYMGFQCNLTGFTDLQDVLSVTILILLSIGSKLSGTLIICRYLKIPSSEGIFLGFILNTRGYADLLFIGAASKSVIEFPVQAYNVVLTSIVLNTIISGIIVAFLAKEEKMFSKSNTALEMQEGDDELRILACVYDPRQVSAILALILALNGSGTSPTTTYSMHLIELVKKIKSNLLYHEKENPELSDDDDDGQGGNDVLEVHLAVDAFTADKKIMINQRKAVSSFQCLYQDVCTEAEDLQVSIILLPFHKHQRIDGKMESGKEGIRTTNQKVIRHAPCSIGVIVERGLARVPGFAQLIATDAIQNVATLFFGGPDDREAIAWSVRISQQSRINLTVIRFLLSSSSPETEEQIEDGTTNEEKDILMPLSGEEAVNDIDNIFMVDFYNRYVASGQIGYVEKYVKNGVETVAALRDIGDLYSLFIVGKGGRGHCSLTIGMSDWEECPELGTVGDVLASSDFNIHGSVLVVQQHRNVKKDLMED